MNSWTSHRDKILQEEIPSDPYFKSIYDFAIAWLSGRKTFTITTSGSTGTPKEIVLSRTQMIASARLTGQVLNLLEGTYALVCLNVNYIAGMMMLVRGLELGWLITTVKPGSNPLLDVPEEASFDFVALVPMQMSAILQDAQTHGRVGVFGKILLGGAAVSEVLLQEIQALGVPVYQSYGMTETVSHVALRRLNGDESQEDYQVMPGIEFGVDERSCLYICGAVTDNRIIQTNDLVEITSSNSFRWLGRADSVINSGGVKISLDKLDQMVGKILQEMNATTDYFSWHEPDEKLGQKLVLFLEEKAAFLNTEILLSKISDRVKRYEIPKAIYFAEQFKRTPTAKIDKKATAQNYLKTPND
ncbi:AMP-binding protein [Persicitalea sp.]|uniref:AMP-binding protein n=1 Tax=Persicitalea sp. TaxID=3100273 RepID=UPI0035943AE9